MVRRALVVLVVGLLFAADGKDKEKKDEDRIQGTWVLESEETDSSKRPPRDTPIKLTLGAEGKGKVENAPGGEADITYERDTTKTPKHLTIMGKGENSRA